MSWTVRTPASNADGREVRTVIESDDSDEVIELLPYWVRNLDDGDEIVIRKV